MNNSNNYLHDIELPATGFPSFILVLLVIIAIFILLLIIYYGYQHQRPIARAKRHLRSLSTAESNPHALARLLQQGLQVKRLSDSSLPKAFLQRLDQARFSAHPCTLADFMQLKDEAQVFLEQQTK
ncbi:MAG TPA: hypothetical protein ENJ33_01975 [Thiothrix sp.]|nr:hypothetical protein [Thiothrix sp.]